MGLGVVVEIVVGSIMIGGSGVMIGGGERGMEEDRGLMEIRCERRVVGGIGGSMGCWGWFIFV